MRENLNVHMTAGLKPKPLTASLFSNLFSLVTPTPSYIPDPKDPRKLIFDLSHFEPDINLDLVKAYIPEVAHIIFRICGSYTVKDEMFPVFWPWAKRIGISRSFYLYNWPGWTVDQHIGNLMGSIETHCSDGDLGTGPIILDAECHAGKTKREVSNHTWELAWRIVEETGKDVWIYTGIWFLLGYMEYQDWMEEMLWWFAQWLSQQTREHPGPVDLCYNIKRENVKIHQTGSRARANEFGGTSYYDSDRWLRSDAEFYEVFGGNPSIPDPPDPGDGCMGLILELKKELNDLLGLQAKDAIDIVEIQRLLTEVKNGWNS